MRWKSFIDIIKRHWLNIFAGILLLVITLVSFDILQLSRNSLMSLAAVYAFFSLIQNLFTEETKFRASNELKDITDKLSKESNRREKRETQVEKQAEEMKTILQKRLERKETSIQLLNNLVTQGLIDEEDLNKHLESLEITSVYLYATTFPPLKENDRKLRTFRRLYPGFLEQNLGFIRMGKRSPFFVTLSRYLPAELRDTRYLKKHLLQKIDELLKEEWTLFLEELKNQKFATSYRRYKDDSYKKHLKVSLLILKGKLSENNIGFVSEQTFYKRFYDLIKSEVDLKKVDLPVSKKIRIMKYIREASFELLLYPIPDKDLKKLKEIESDIKNTFKIQKITDYANISLKDLEETLAKNFPKEVAMRYSRGLKKRARRYEKALSDLSIRLD